VHLEFEIKQLRKSLSESISERQQLTSKLDGMRGKVQQLSEAQKRLRANRFQALLMLRMHARIGPALRRWQSVSLVVDHSDSSRVAGSRDLLPMDAATTGEARTFDAGEQRQSRIIALQRELLDREAQLGAAHQASLDWREERSRLTQQLAAAQADAQATRSRMADAALAAAAAAEREARAELTGAQRQLKELRTKLSLVEDGLEKGASESHELRQALAASVQELRQARAQAEAAQRAERHASARVEEIEDARISEAEHAKERIDALEAQVREMQEASVAAVKNRPLTVQREMRDSQKEAEALKAQVAELTRKGNLQQKRMNDAEARMEGLQKELERYRQKQSHSLKLALASPRTREGLVAHSLSAGGGFGSPVPSSPRHTEHPQETYLAPQPIYQPPAARGASPRRGAETSPRAGPLRPQLAAAAPSAAGSEQGSERATRPAKSRMPPMAPSR
jgi:DNA repair exonuclease SbcCD ATPase subunit